MTIQDAIRQRHSVRSYSERPVSRMAHYGKFSGISNYLAMIGPKSDELLDEKIGYPAEQPQPKDKWLPENVSYNEYK